MAEGTHFALLFQHAAARRRLDFMVGRHQAMSNVSTRSRPKAAGPKWNCHKCAISCFNTQPSEGGWGEGSRAECVEDVSTRSRPKAAGRSKQRAQPTLAFQHAAARRRLVNCRHWQTTKIGFQHAAARRRLVADFGNTEQPPRFNTQPPEGGWISFS